MEGREESMELQPLSSKWGTLFDKFDVDNDGQIPVYEFRETIQSQLQNHVPVAVLRELIRNADQNHDGFINKREFIRLAQSNLGKKILGEIWLNWYLKKVVGEKAAKNIYRNKDLIDGEYEEEYKWCPPPLSMITASIVQIAIFMATYEGLSNLLKNPVSAELVYNPYRRAEAWRFLSYMLIHGGWEHLIMNITVQLALGIPLELVHRWWRVLIIYLIGIIAGSLGTSITDPTTFLCGASGGVYALMLAHIATIILNWSEMEHPVIWLCFFLIIMTADTGNAIYIRYFKNIINKVGYAAHFFGAITGLLCGLFVLRNLEKLKWENQLRAASMIIFSLLLTTAIIWNIFFPEYFPNQQI